MHRTTHRTLVGALALSLALLVAACGTSGGASDGEKDTTTTAAKATTTTTEEETTTTEAAPDDDAQDRADSVDLSVSDFPDGWDSSPASDDDDEDSPMKDCDPSFSDDSAKLAKHTTDTFSTGDLDNADGTQLSAETVVFTDADTADAAVAVFDDADVVSCIDDALKSFLGDSQGLTAEGSLEDDDIDLGTDNSAGVSGTYTLTAEDGSSVNATVAILAMNTGDVGTMVTIVSLGDSLDPSTLQDPLTTLADLLNEA